MAPDTELNFKAAEADRRHIVFVTVVDVRKAHQQKTLPSNTNKPAGHAQPRLPENALNSESSGVGLDGSSFFPEDFTLKVINHGQGNGFFRHHVPDGLFHLSTMVVLPLV